MPQTLVNQGFAAFLFTSPREYKCEHIFSSIEKSLSITPSTTPLDMQKGTLFIFCIRPYSELRVICVTRVTEYQFLPLDCPAKTVTQLATQIEPKRICVTALNSPPFLAAYF
jgi:hypothetical protein